MANILIPDENYVSILDSLAFRQHLKHLHPKACPLPVLVIFETLKDDLLLFPRFSVLFGRSSYVEGEEKEEAVEKIR